MDRHLAKFLGYEIARQFKLMPYASRTDMDLNPLRLGALISKTSLRAEDTSRMQFRVPEIELENNSQTAFFKLRRVGTTYLTNYKPGKLVKVVRKLKESRMKQLQSRRSNVELDAEVLCRIFREDENIRPLLYASSEKTYKYFVMAELDELRDFKQEFQGGNMFVRIPLFFIPGANQKDIDRTLTFSYNYQKPDAVTCDDWFEEFK